MRGLRIFFIFFFLLPIFLSPQVAFCIEQPTIAVICSRGIKPYYDALSGFKKELGKSGYDASVRQYDLESAGDKESQIMQEVKDLKPVLILAIGTEAALFAKDNLKDFPVVFSMVLDPVKAGIVESPDTPGDGFLGVSLDIPPELQFEKLKEMLPKVSRVGVIYDAKEKEWLKGIEIAAKRLNLTIVAKPVNSASDVPAKLDEISKEVDCLWAQVDPLIYNSQSSQHILLTLLRNKIPLMAFSAQYVKAGALLALECDYADIGKQSAQIAVKILKDGASGTVALTFPAKFGLVINRRIAGILGIDIPKKILEEASEVYE